MLSELAKGLITRRFLIAVGPPLVLYFLRLSKLNDFTLGLKVLPNVVPIPGVLELMAASDEKEPDNPDEPLNGVLLVPDLDDLGLPDGAEYGITLFALVDDLPDLPLLPDNKGELPNNALDTSLKADNTDLTDLEDLELVDTRLDSIDDSALEVVDLGVLLSKLPEE